VVIDFLINRARGFIFTTAPSPLMAAVARAALGLVAGHLERQFRLAALVAHAGQMFSAKLGITPSATHVQPIIIGDNARTMAVAAACQAAGFDLRGIRPPTVPQGTSRLRISLTLNATAADVDDLVNVLERTV
jgi:8-amino-7-oxononanoate synthase